MSETSAIEISSSPSAGERSIKIKPLSGRQDYNVWSIRIKAHLKHLNLWDSGTDAPSDSTQGYSILVSTLGDDLLEQVSYLDVPDAPHIWAHLRDTFITRIFRQNQPLSTL
jgi:hypothetical protein